MTTPAHKAVTAIVLGWVLWLDQSSYDSEKPTAKSRKEADLSAVAAYETKAECEKAAAAEIRPAPDVKVVVPGGYLIPVPGGSLTNRYVARRYLCWPAGSIPEEHVSPHRVGR